jgi:GT2 family glycosyltransferase
MLMRRGAFGEAGGFDEGFFCYSEDTDLYLRVRLLGWKCALAERAVVYHDAGGTLGTISPEKTYLVERNRVSVLLRYYPARSVAASPFFTAFRYAGLAAATGRFMWKGPGEGALMQGGLGANVRALLRAYRDALRRFPTDLQRRREWRARAKTPQGQMAQWLRDYGLDGPSLFRLEVP